MKLPDKVYNVLKWLTMIALPAIGSFWSEMAEVWGLPYGDEIAVTITKLCLLIGTLIGVSTYFYNRDKEK